MVANTRHVDTKRTKRIVYLLAERVLLKRCGRVFVYNRPQQEILLRGLLVIPVFIGRVSGRIAPDGGR
jgi:hypothetical protein